MKTLATATVRSTDTPYRQDIETRGFHLVGDEPPEPAGPGPYDYFLTGLGMCTTITLQMYAERKGWEEAVAEKWLGPNLGYEPEA